MELKELIDTINTYGARIIFDSPEDITKEIYYGKFSSPLYFTPVEGKERKRYEKMKNQHDFISTTAAIHIADLSIEHIIDLFECDGTGICEFTRNIIAPYCNQKIDNNIVYITFVFLHEMGHWIQFNSLNKNVFDFIQKDLVLEKNNFDKMENLKKQRKERIDRGNKCKLTAREKKLFWKYMKEYRAIPKEKEADEFALSKMEEALQLIQKV